MIASHPTFCFEWLLNCRVVIILALKNKQQYVVVGVVKSQNSKLVTSSNLKSNTFKSIGQQMERLVDQQIEAERQIY